MMRILQLILIITFISYCQSNPTESELNQKLIKLGLEENWKDSQKVAYQLLENFKNSDQRETYYNALALSISNECWDIRRENKQPPDTTEQRGTITLYISERLTEDVKQEYNELIKVINSYFKEYPDGQFEDSFYTFLITAYSLSCKHDNVIETCKKLYNCDKPNLKLKAAFQLARYSHFNKDYETALKYYKFIIENLGENNNRILYNYLIANCFFELKDLQSTYKYLSIVLELTENDRENDVRKMAEMMKSYLDNNDDKFTRKFVVFRDPANQKN
jgi:tetratricopeptide (TPR) repeat protein